MESGAIVAWVRAGATLLELPAAAMDEAEVVGHFARLAAVAESLERIGLGPEVEPLPVFVR